MSWYSAGSFELSTPWWISDYDANDRAIFCAAIPADSAEEARRKLLAAHDDKSVTFEWRFCERRAPRESPFSERFQAAAWMRWPNDGVPNCAGHERPAFVPSPEIAIGQNANPCACRGSIPGSPFHSLEKCSQVCEMCEGAPAETLGAFPADDPMGNNFERQKICLACAKKSRSAKCPICNGTGEDPADRGSETDENGISWDCPECGGTGTIAIRRDEFAPAPVVAQPPSVSHEWSGEDLDRAGLVLEGDGPERTIRTKNTGPARAEAPRSGPVEVSPSSRVVPDAGNAPGGPAPRPHPPEVDFAPEVFERLRSLPQPPEPSDDFADTPDVFAPQFADQGPVAQGMRVGSASASTGQSTVVTEHAGSSPVGSTNLPFDFSISLSSGGAAGHPLPAAPSSSIPRSLDSAVGPTNEQMYRLFVDDVEAALVKAEEDLAASQEGWQDRNEADLEDARPAVQAIQRRFALETPQHAEWLIRRLRELAAAREALKAQARAMVRELEAHMRSLSERFEIPLGDVLDGMLGDQTGRKRPKKSAKTLAGDIGRHWSDARPKVVDKAAATAWAEKHDDLADPKLGAIRYVLDGRALVAHVKATGDAVEGVAMVDAHDDLYIAWRSEDGGKTTLNVSRLARGGPMVAGEDEDGVDEIEGGA